MQKLLNRNILQVITYKTFFSQGRFFLNVFHYCYVTATIIILYSYNQLYDTHNLIVKLYKFKLSSVRKSFLGIHEKSTKNSSFQGNFTFQFFIRYVTFFCTCSSRSHSGYASAKIYVLSNPLLFLQIPKKALH